MNPTPTISPSQAERLRRFRATQSVDLHCHCLPGLDDGPSDLAASIELCRALVADGITDVVASPHQLGRYDGRNAAPHVRAAIETLSQTLEQHRVPLKLHAGADVRIDERIVNLLERDEILTIADDRKYLLLELPHDIFVNPQRVISALRAAGICPIVTHPERHGFLQQRPDVIRPWLESGAILQITSGSFTGDFGPAAQQSAWTLLRRGWVSVVASDAHDPRRRPPRMTAAIDAISRNVNPAVARRLCIDNPLRVLKGQALFTYAALPAAGGAA